MYKCQDWKKVAVENKLCKLYNSLLDKDDINKARTMYVWLWDAFIRQIKYYLLMNKMGLLFKTCLDYSK